MSTSSDDVFQYKTYPSSGSPPAQHHDHDQRDDEGGLHAGSLVAGSVLSAGIGIWLAQRRRRNQQARVKTTPPQRRPSAKPSSAAAGKSATPVIASKYKSGEKTSTAEHSRFENAIRIATLLLPLAAAFRKSVEAHRAEKVRQAKKKETPRPAVSNLRADLEPAPVAYLDPAADVAMLKGGTRTQQAWQLARAAVNAWLDDFAPSMGAAIAYYTIFSIAPMLVIAIAVAGMLFGHDAAQGEIVNQIRDIVGIDGAMAIQGLLKSASEPREGMIATLISVATLIVGATAVFAELQSALDRIWRIPVERKTGFWQLLRTRLLSFGLILGLGFLLIISLVVSAALAAIGKWWGGWFEGWQLVLQTLNFVLSFIVFSALFSMIYKFMPRVNLSWHDVWIGAATTTLLFIIGKYLIGLYLGRTGVTSSFGAAGAFALLLVWIYYSAQIFLLGAEFTWIYANNFGSRAVRQKLVGTPEGEGEAHVVVPEVGKPLPVKR